ncbi:MAG: hypothetical protein A3G32_02715 [Deltaproteobacteria bacterium RIFCSPLOWO2_12_FULL_40_28]|nr:MAG: hypothetical protein A3C45_00095 [Deltaproteobacteria bacterium RIFCSPHIGHO2_02_FULL_40_28]OGQ20030.1 MAG: hypothetical protein A3E27_02760 [Deltaproteobacteria bacterium RIFCSPHIGHO2_12_FULL_40_32]OGQ40597.1 MAG: hypothetical protein A3I69_10185 [Deltaproteobacteria bacterium RIFCSPLOWO2_02_FULL_40_36]OGQ54266.1 MAG: hypothetical protein A3G32_02715 [Deltaproteobacteria bacterium RIFCSPLOWO2_12_FULL_40_28]
MVAPLVYLALAAVPFIASCMKNEEEGETPTPVGPVTNPEGDTPEASLDTGVDSGGTTPTGDAYVDAAIPSNVGTFDIEGSVFSSLWVNNEGEEQFYYVHKVGGTTVDDPTTPEPDPVTVPQEFYLGQCSTLPISPDQQTAICDDLGYALPFSDQIAVSSHVKNYEIDGEGVIVVPYNSVGQDMIEVASTDAITLQDSADHQGVFVYATDGTLYANHNLASMTTDSGWKLSGAEDSAYISGQNELAVSFSQFASGAKAGDENVITNQYNMAYPPGAIAYLNIENPLDQNPNVRVVELTDGVDYFYNPTAMHLKDGRLEVVANLGTGDGVPVKLSIDPRQNDLSLSGALTIVTEGIPVGGAYNATATESGDFLLTGATGFGEENTGSLTRIASDASVIPYNDLPNDFTFVAGAEGFHDVEGQEALGNYGVVVSGQYEYVPGEASDASLWWYYNGNWTDLAFEDATGAQGFALPPVVMEASAYGKQGSLILAPVSGIRTETSPVTRVNVFATN